MPGGGDGADGWGKGDAFFWPGNARVSMCAEMGCVMCRWSVSLAGRTGGGQVRGDGM